MTALAQVRHILLKDVREARWLLLMYVSLVAVATLRSINWMISAQGVMGLLLVITIVLVGAFAAASVVQADSPTSHSAFWTKVPLNPLAMVAAKATFILLLIGIGVVGQALGVAAYAIDAAEVAAFSGRSALAFGVWLLFGVLLAAVLPDLRAFTLAFILIPLGSFIGMNFVFLSLMAASADPTAERLPSLIPGLSMTGARIIGLAVQLGSVALIVWLYRTRDVGRWWRAAGVLLAVGMFLPLAGGPVFTTPGEVVPPDQRFSFALASEGTDVRVGSGVSDELRFVIEAPPMPTHLAWGLAHGALIIGLREGSSLRIPLRGLPSSSEGLTPRLTGVRWFEPPPRAGGGHQVSASLTAAQQRLVTEGITSVALEGEIHVFEATVVATLPLVVNTEIAVDGRRIRLDEWTDGSSGPTIRLRQSAVGRDRLSHLPVTPTPTNGCALINRGRSEGLVLPQYGGGGSIDGLVLPGTPVRSEEWRCRRLHWDGLERPTDEWLRDAELMIVSRVHRGSYPLRVELPR